MLAQAASAFNCGDAPPRLLLFALVFILLPACTGDPPRLEWSFPISADIRQIVIESWRAPDARIIRTGSSKTFAISARPVLQPLSQHGPEPTWQNAPAEEWPFRWESRPAGGILELRSHGETRSPHHRYLLEDLTITVAEGVAVERRKQTLEEAP